MRASAMRRVRLRKSQPRTILALEQKLLAKCEYLDELKTATLKDRSEANSEKRWAKHLQEKAVRMEVDAALHAENRLYLLAGLCFLVFWLGVWVGKT